jgi:hypothetical protein
MVRSSRCIGSTCFSTVLMLAAVIQPSNVGTATEREILRILLTRQGRSVPTVVVVDATPMALFQPTAPQWTALGSSAANALKSKVENAREGASDVFAAASFPPWTRLVTHAELQPLRRGPNLAVRWHEFEERFGVREFVAFSRPVVSDDSLDALVYRVYSDGPESAVGELFWLHRAATSDTWSIGIDLPIMIS